METMCPPGYHHNGTWAHDVRLPLICMMTTNIYIYIYR